MSVRCVCLFLCDCLLPLFVLVDFVLSCVVSRCIYCAVCVLWYALSVFCCCYRVLSCAGVWFRCAFGTCVVLVFVLGLYYYVVFCFVLFCRCYLFDVVTLFGFVSFFYVLTLFDLCCTLFVVLKQQVLMVLCLCVVLDRKLFRYVRFSWGLCY